MSPRGAAAYRQTEAHSSSPLGLVVMLYDGAIRFVVEAREGIATRNARKRTEAVSRALAIVAELQNTLNVKEGGEVARELDRLYAYMSARLFDVTARADDEAAREVHRLLQSLRESWATLAASK